TMVAVGQQPMPEAGSGAIPAAAQNTPASQNPFSASNTPAADIAELKATVRQLQERLNQLEGSHAYAGPESSDESKVMGDESKVITDSSLITHQSSLISWPMTAYWKDGLQIESQNEIFRVHVGGTLQVDSGWNAVSQAVESGPGGIGELQ